MPRHSVSVAAGRAPAVLVLALAVVSAQQAPWTAEQLQQRVTMSVAAGARSLSVPRGNYFFSNSSLMIVGAHGFELQATDAADPADATVAATPVRLWFDIGHGLVVKSSSGVRVTGPLELDYTTGAHY